MISRLARNSAAITEVAATAALCTTDRPVAQSRFNGVALFAFAALIASCVSGPHFYMQYGNEYQEIELAKILKEHPLEPGENIKVANLGRSDSASQHIVQVRDREIPHVHKLHDVTVTMLQGQGYLVMESKRLNLKAGDVVHIPRGAVHYFVNTDRSPAVAMAVYAPAYDGKDTHPVSLQNP